MFDIIEGRWDKIDTKSEKTIEVKKTSGRYRRVREIILEEAVILLKKEIKIRNKIKDFKTI